MFVLRWLRRLFKTILWLIVLVVLIPIVGLAYGFLTIPALDKAPLPGIADGAPPAELAAKVRQAIPGYQSPESSTWLAYPKWRPSTPRATMPPSSTRTSRAAFLTCPT
ncbi:hypothetical protein [Mesorhizobium sp. B2-7-1]|uniref:hypothetical protein n=1 Tax=Mesorhizobium sp. B2-7-1 TaxID=2589909 RepID=UPI001FED7FD1|nr:hypothetical protein [Mesorhizobium sp. B2-7-1]